MNSSMAVTAVLTFAKKKGRRGDVEKGSIEGRVSGYKGKALLPKVLIEGKNSVNP
jgi:hypothetical protein